MAQNIYRRDTRSNLLEITPSRKEIVTIEDYAKHGIMFYGQLRVVGQLLERDGGLEVRGWDTTFGKGIIGQNSFDVSTSVLKFGSGPTGAFSFTSGMDTTASGANSTASGNSTTASGANSDASGKNSIASEENSHAEGQNTEASGENSHAEGFYTISSGDSSHSEGSNTVAQGDHSHAEGKGTLAMGGSSHVEGRDTIATEENSHAEGIGTTASGENSHAEGFYTISSADSSHAEGRNTEASGTSSHAEGIGTTASGDYSHAGGQDTTASGIASEATGNQSRALGDYTKASGYNTLAGYKEIFNVTLDVLAEVNIPLDTRVQTAYTTGVGFVTPVITLLPNETIYYAMASGDTPNTNIEDSKIYLFNVTGGLDIQNDIDYQNDYFAYSDNDNDGAGVFWSETGEYLNDTGVTMDIQIVYSDYGDIQFTENFVTPGTPVYLYLSRTTSAFGLDLPNTPITYPNVLRDESIYVPYAVAEGFNTISSGVASHAEGQETIASGDNSHAEGYSTHATGNNSHTEGSGTEASGTSSHAGGGNSIASGVNSFAHGNRLRANNDNETVVGKLNDDTNANTIFTIGIGLSDLDRRNALEVEVDGSITAPELTIVNIDKARSLLTREFVQEKIALENWFTDFTVTNTGTIIYRSNIPSTDFHANISAVFLGGIMLRPSKYSLVDDGGFKAVSLGTSITLNSGDWVSLQNNRVYIKD